MSTEQLTREAMALPLPERLLLAQILWDSIEGGPGNGDEEGGLDKIIRRSEALSSGRVAGVVYEEVMKAAREAIKCEQGRGGEALCRELKDGAEAPWSDFVALDMEEVIRQAKLRYAARCAE